MVLDVTCAGDVDGACELVEDLGVVLAYDVRHHVQTAAVWHANAHLVELFVRGLLADLVQQNDYGFTALQGETFLPHELGLQKGLEDLGLVQLVEGVHVLLVGEGLAGHFDAVLEPLALLGIRDVHVFDGNGATVGVLQDGENFPQRAVAPFLPAEGADGELAVQVPDGQAMCLLV